jgi:membrane protein YqaA with SNARE-associated domain
MRIFKPMYEAAMRWSAHPRAPWYLAGISFIEAFIFPGAPEIMLVPMTLAKPRKWFTYASISLASSMVGSVIGYAMGRYLFDLARPLLEDIGWLTAIDAYVTQLRALDGWAVFWLLVVGGFTPVPLKIFTWASGIVGVPLLAFLAAMLVGRGKRVYLLCGLVRLGGERVERTLHRWIDWVAWGVLALLVLVIVYVKYLR